MAAKNVDKLYYTRSDDTSDAHRHRLSPTRSNYLPANSQYQYAEIVRRPLAQESYHQSIDRNPHTSSDRTQRQEGDRDRRRPQEAKEQRFSEPIKWVFDEDNAEAYSRAIQWGCVKDRGLKKTVKKLERAEIITDDFSEGGELVRGYLNAAKTNNDPSCLLKAYTVESQFYRGLNEYMASGSRSKVFKKLRCKWSGYYTGMIMRNPAFKNYYFRGTTYRGMQVTSSQIEQYEVGVALANKAFQSTSRSKAFALTFACPEERKHGTKPVIIIYTILDPKSALNIESLSEYPEEEEVLLVPGTLFITDSVNKSREPYEFQLRQLPWDE
jgi:hypothetical protein